MNKNDFFFCIILMTLSININAQNTKINWISFEQLEDSLKENPKKVFISFYADWCLYCKKMDKVAFRDKDVIRILNTDYYAIKMNAESKDTIIFEGEKYMNKQLGKKRRPTHEIPILLASRKNKSFTLPVTLILNENFNVEKRFFEYLSPKQLLSVLNSK